MPQGTRHRPLVVVMLVLSALLIGIAVLAAWRAEGRAAEWEVLGETMTDLHRASAHFPIGLLLSSVFFDVLGIMMRRPDLRAAGFWTHLLGFLGAVTTVLVGLLGNPFAGETNDIAAKVLVHQRIGIATLVVFGLLALWRLLRRNQFGKWEGAVYLAASVAGVALVGATGYLGGHLMD